MELQKCLKKIKFLERYKEISTRHSDFDNGLRGNKIDLYVKVLKRYNYQIKYFKKETFYKIEEIINNKTFILQLVLKDGLVEPMLFAKINDKYTTPDGRFDAICEKLDLGFSRKNFPIPSYSCELELVDILETIFSIYEDFKKEVIKEYSCFVDQKGETDLDGNSGTFPK